jgi:hypothetical protein
MISIEEDSGGQVMSRIARFLFTTLMATVIGCSHLNGATAPPPDSQDAQDFRASIQAGYSETGGGAHHLWGYWLVGVDPEKDQFEILPVRDIEDHLNVLRWLEQGPCTNCLKIPNIVNSDHGTKLLTISLKHPFPSPNLTGFDVRGIAMFNGSHAFPTAGFNTPDRSHGDGELINADGYTTLYNYTTMGSGSGGMQGYIKGKLATFAVPKAKLNGFKRFVSSGAENTRNAFYAGDTIEQTYDIDMPDSAFVFGYAVDTSWAPPTTKPVTDPMKDFPPSANCPEPWRVETQLSAIGSGLDTHGGEVQLSVNVYDYQGKDSYSPPILECPELFDGTKTASWISDGSGFSSWGIKVGNEKLAPGGDYKCLIKVVDNANAGSPPYLDLTAYQIQTLHVNPPGWARTWGGLWVDYGYSVTVGSSGDEYVCGFFWDTIDFDPGYGADNHTSSGNEDAFLSKFDSFGNFVWVRTWGGTGNDRAYCVAVDGSGNVYVTGIFEGTVDFDPGAGTDTRSSNGDLDVFISRFDPSGNFAWARTWGGADADEGTGVAVANSEGICVTGYFSGTVDFDPGAAKDDHTSNGGGDVFLSAFDPLGNFKWARTWGGTSFELGHWLATDSSGSIYVTGYFGDTVDFDPSTDTDYHTASLCGDFLSKFDLTGTFLWARTWGGDGLGEAIGIAVDGSGNVYVTGYFEGSVDFDPGAGVDNHTSVENSLSPFLSSFDPSGNFNWAVTWGGADWAEGLGVDADGLGNIYVTGDFSGTADFDPGAGIDNHKAHGFVEDVFLSKFDQSGNFMWARTWGGLGSDYGNSVAAAASGDVYVTGSYQKTADFDPGAGTDNHTAEYLDDVFLSKFPPDGNW